MNCVVKLWLKNYRVIDTLYSGVESDNDIKSAIDHCIATFSACNENFADEIEDVDYLLFPQEEDENETNEYERF